MSDDQKRKTVLREFHSPHEIRKAIGLRTDPLVMDDMANEILRLRTENDHLRIQLGSDTGIDCCLCNIRIYGTMIGAGDGTGQKFAHPECYYRMRVVELESAVERVRALHASEQRHVGWIDMQCCSECNDDDNDYVYPCPTLRALEGYHE